eukprot:scaffold39657_cov23-Tisochrysis_lutea.AAC.3
MAPTRELSISCSGTRRICDTYVPASSFWKTARERHLRTDQGPSQQGWCDGGEAAKRDGAMLCATPHPASKR